MQVDAQVTEQRCEVFDFPVLIYRGRSRPQEKRRITRVFIRGVARSSLGAHATEYIALDFDDCYAGIRRELHPQAMLLALTKAGTLLLVAFCLVHVPNTVEKLWTCFRDSSTEQTDYHVTQKGQPRLVLFP